MNAIMSYYFLSERYERDYVFFLNWENDIKHALINANYATHFSQKINNQLRVRS